MSTYLFDKLIFWISHAVCAVNLLMWVYAAAVLLRVRCRGMMHKERELRSQKVIDYAMVKELHALHETLQVSFWFELILLAMLWFAGIEVERLHILTVLLETGELSCMMTALALCFGHVIRVCASSYAIHAKGVVDAVFECAKRMITISLAYGIFYWVLHL